jgi:hypothetical protein
MTVCFLPLLQEGREICKTRNQFDNKALPHFWVVYLDPTDKCDRPLPSRLPGVNRTVIVSQIRVAGPGSARFTSPWTDLPHTVSRSFSRQLLITLGAVATAARDRATRLAASTPDPSAQRPSPVCRVATSGRNPCRWSVQGQPEARGAKHAASRNYDRYGTVPTVGAIPPHAYTPY